MIKNWPLFGGFKHGKSEMSFIPRDIDEGINEEEDT